MIGNIFLGSSFISKYGCRIIKVIMSLISITSWHIPPQWQKRFLIVVFIFRFFYDAIKWSYDHLYMYKAIHHQNNVIDTMLIPLSSWWQPGHVWEAGFSKLQNNWLKQCHYECFDIALTTMTTWKGSKARDSRLTQNKGVTFGRFCTVDLHQLDVVCVCNSALTALLQVTAFIFPLCNPHLHIAFHKSQFSKLSPCNSFFLIVVYCLLWQCTNCQLF